MENTIEVKELKKKFGKVTAVNDVSFEIKEGEIFGFLGPNGAGKTTTIRCIMDFIRPTEGKIFINGIDAQKDSVKAKEVIGYLSGNVRLYGNWTGRDHIDFIESIRGKSRNVNELLKKLDFNPNVKFHNLSSGNKQKLGLIIALMSDPKILIMDEPTVGLDPLLQNTIYEILLDLKKKGVTILISSHNLSEVEKLCDKVGIIKEGKMVAVEPINELGEKKLHRVEVMFDSKFEASEFNIQGVERIDEIKDGLSFTVSGDINPLIKKLASYKLQDIQVSHASLEDVFLKFYGREK